LVFGSRRDVFRHDYVDCAGWLARFGNCAQGVGILIVKTIFLYSIKGSPSGEPFLFSDLNLNEANGLAG